MEVVTFTCFFSECTRKLNNEVCFLSVKKCVCEGFWSIWGGVGGGGGCSFGMNSSNSNHSKNSRMLDLSQEHLEVIGNSKICMM